MSITGKNILVVDDFQDIRESLSEIFEDAGCQVASAENGLKAIKVLKQQPIDLIVSDILMPEMDGLELVKATRDTHPDMKFILISGGGLHNEDFNYLEMSKLLTGISTVLSKPFKPEVLLNMTEELLTD